MVLPTDRATGRPRGFAFVELGDESAAARAIEELDGKELGGRTLRVSAAEERRPRSGPPTGRPSFGGHGGGGSGNRPKPKGSRRNIRRRKRSL